MATIKELSMFLDRLPEDTAVVMVVQSGSRFVALHSESLEVSLPEGEIGANWPRSVWEGMQMAMSGKDEEELPGLFDWAEGLEETKAC